MHRRHRLRNKADFEQLRRYGQRWHHPLTVLVVKANGQQISRFGFIASRRVGKATARNRAKRVLREAVRKLIDDIKPGSDCLFIASKQMAGADFTEVEVAVAQLLSHAGMLSEVRKQ